MPRRGKQYRAALDSFDVSGLFEPDEAIRIVKQTAFAKFDETVELHLNTGLDPRHADQQIRGTALLPHGLGKTVRVLVFAEADGARLATQENADFVGDDDLIKRVEGGFIDFDVALAQRELMGKVGRLGRILGPRGLMPSPRSGTVVEAQDLPRAIRDARQGRVEFRLDRTALIHTPIGKVSFDEAALLENMATVMNAIVKAKPAGAKGQFIRSVTLTSTMGPGVKLDINPALALRPSA